jgi:nucleotide-binding universal stress UspA family protein
MLQFLVDSPVFRGLTLHIVTVAKHTEDATAIAHIEEAQQQARSAGFESICRLIEGEPEQRIADYVVEQNISLLLMGAYRHSRVRHLVIGSTTAQMLRSSHIPVLLFR